MHDVASMKAVGLQLGGANLFANLFAPSASPRHTLTPWQFWQSLPVASKLLVALVVAEACLWLGFISGTGARIATVSTQGTLPALVRRSHTCVPSTRCSPSRRKLRTGYGRHAITVPVGCKQCCPVLLRNLHLLKRQCRESFLQTTKLLPHLCPA
jgi:hypothetical protein